MGANPRQPDHHGQDFRGYRDHAVGDHGAVGLISDDAAVDRFGSSVDGVEPPSPASIQSTLTVRRSQRATPSETAVRRKRFQGIETTPHHSMPMPSNGGK